MSQSDLDFVAERWNCSPEEVIHRLVRRRAEEIRADDRRIERLARRDRYKAGQAWEAVVVAGGVERLVRREIVKLLGSTGRRGGHGRYSMVEFREDGRMFTNEVSWASFDRWAIRHDAKLESHDEPQKVEGELILVGLGVNGKACPACSFVVTLASKRCFCGHPFED